MVEVEGVIERVNTRKSEVKMRIDSDDFVASFRRAGFYIRAEIETCFPAPVEKLKRSVKVQLTEDVLEFQQSSL